MPPIHKLIPNAEDLLALEPEELAPVLLQYICSGSAYASGTPSNPIKRGNVFTGSATPGSGYPSEYANREPASVNCFQYVCSVHSRALRYCCIQAFRAVEVAVRDATGLPQSLVGTELMRKAFAESVGPLTDATLVLGEQQATSHLFAGAIGLFKNPTSHRADAISKPQDAVALVMLADYLLRFVERRLVGRKFLSIRHAD